jgi:hypothetical protein
MTVDSKPESYPLWCVDSGDADSESRYLGPFDTLVEANAAWSESTPTFISRVRRCRRIRFDEVVNPSWLLDTLIGSIEVDSSAGEGPCESWRDFDEPAIGSSPETLASFQAWAAENLKVDQYICEGDEGE